jgi:hypothetical protein
MGKAVRSRGENFSLITRYQVIKVIVGGRISMIA